MLTRILQFMFILLVAGSLCGGAIGGLSWFLSANFMHGQHMAASTALKIGAGAGLVFCVVMTVMVLRDRRKANPKEVIYE